MAVGMIINDQIIDATQYAVSSSPSTDPTPTPDTEPEIIDGGTITPINDIQTWLKCAEITDKAYTTIGEVLNDSVTLLTLMSNEEAMKYLARSASFADDICSNQAAMELLGNSPHVDDTVLNSDLWVSEIKQSPYKSQVLPQAELFVGNTYKFGGYNWIVAEKSGVSGYAVLQSTGVTGGAWPGYAMSKFGNNNYYSSNIDGQDISDYNQKTKDLYAAIKAAEYTSAPYGKGLFLVSNSKAGTTSNGSQGSGHYWTALKTAAANYSSFGATNLAAWLGTVYGSSNARFVNSNGYVYYGYSQNDSLVVAPAFNLDTCLIKVDGNEIVLL